MNKIAALYVKTGGPYFGLDNVDPWDIHRDARRYDELGNGDPVIAHPPCNHWSMLANVNAARWSTFKVGDDAGCFAAAVRSVQLHGGVLEHPAFSMAWSAFNLPEARRGCWTGSLTDPVGGISTMVSQSAYGHVCRKQTWLYAVGCVPLPMRWEDVRTDTVVGAGVNSGECTSSRRATSSEAIETPLAFRSALIELAESVR